MFKRSVFSFFFLFTFLSFSIAQLHDNTWLTGSLGPYSVPALDENSKLDFNESPPIITFTENYGGQSVCGTTISDAEGNLLFYTNCQQIANFKNELMENGDSINFDYEYSSYGYGQGSRMIKGIIALPIEGSPSEYYLLHVNTGGSDSEPGGAYLVGTHLLLTKVDMSLNGGEGAVVEKNTVIIEDEILPGALSATRHANGRDWWVIVFKHNQPAYYRVLVSAEGVFNLGEETTDVSIRQGYPEGGSSAFSPDGSTFSVLSTNYLSHESQPLYIFDFDRCLGLLSNSRGIHYSEHIHNFQYGWFYLHSYGCSFSPNSRYLYLSDRIKYYQIDLLALSPQDAIQTVAIEDGWHYGGPNQQWLFSLFGFSGLGRDGRIYSTTVGYSDRFHVIEQPNNPGIDCKVNQHSLKLNGINWYSIPNHPNYRLGPLEGSGCDTLGIERAVYIHAHPYPEEGCVGGSGHFEVTAFGTGKGYQWQSSQDGGATWEDLSDGAHFSGVHSEYLIVENITADMDGTRFRCVVTGNVSTEASRPAPLTVLGAPPTASLSFEQNIDSLYFFDQSQGSEHVRWYFGTGDSSVQSDTRYLYREAGTFTVAMVATNACGQDTAFQQIVIAPLFADFEVERRVGCAPFTTTITSLSPYRSSPLRFAVDTGKPWPWGGQSNHLRSYHTLNYEHPGVFDANHQVWDGSTTAEITKEDYVTVLTGTNPVADIELSQNGGSLSLNAPFALADEYVWYFANGDSLTGQLAEYEISAPGIYEVQLATTNHCGTATGSIDVLVGELEAAFSAGATVGCAPFTVQFENQTAFANADFVWHLPGAQPGVSQQLAPVVTYAQPGLYDATLIVWADSLADTLTIENFIEILPDDCPNAALTATTDGLSLTAWTSCPDKLSYTWLMGNGDVLNSPAVVYEYPTAGTYVLTTIVSGPCTSDTLTTTVTVEGPSATGSRDGRQLVHLAPNPANGSVLVISEGQPFGEATFELYSPLGVLVLQKKEAAWGRHRRIELEGLPSGVYFYRFQVEGAPAQVGRLVVE